MGDRYYMNYSRCTFMPVKGLNGQIKVDGDKSISHRAIIFASIAEGKSEINNFLTGEDCLNTISCFRQMGVEISIDKNNVFVEANGFRALKEPRNCLDVGNSGTTIRLMAGLLSACNFYSVLTGDDSIRSRPMNRVVDPLKQMGAHIYGRESNKLAPLSIIGSELKAITYNSPVASAQIKSSILLAGLWADGVTKVIEPYKSRDHTERMLISFGGNIIEDEYSAMIKGQNIKLVGQRITVPGDISSAAFLIIAGLLVPNSEIVISDVGINPTRSGIIDILLDMGANIQLVNKRMFANEPVADLIVKSSNLKGTIIQGSIIPRLIDELPVLMIAAAVAEGKTVIKDAAELRVKETDRIQVMHDQLLKVGVLSNPTSDGIIIEGGQIFKTGRIDTYGDHRIGMAFAIAACIADGPITIDAFDAVNISFPNFLNIMKSIGANYEL